jgi:ABC-2 type transport system ATP-binding protein
VPTQKSKLNGAQAAVTNTVTPADSSAAHHEIPTSQSATQLHSDDSVVRVHALVKKYKKGADALKGLDLEVKKGDLYGLVGPDGAGKTTALKILAGVMEPTSGDVKLLGKKPRDARAKIGYVPQNCALYPELSVEENLVYQAGLHGVSEDDIEKLRETHLEKMGLLKFQDRLASKLSGGMKQKLALCCALVSNPEIILLDEPTTGLDPIARRELWQALSSLSHEGVTAIIATPFLDEAERCNKIALMYDGKIQLEGSPRELQNALKMQRLTFTIKNHDKLNEIPAIIEGLKLQGIKDIYPFGDRLEILTAQSDTESEAAIRKEFETAGLNLSEARASSPSLENFFVIKLQELGSRKTKEVEFPHWKSRATADSTARSTSTSGDVDTINSTAGSTDTSGGTITRGDTAPERLSSESAIRAEHLMKMFEEFKAVDDVSVDIKYSEIFGLLGANGAGKTTTIKMLCGLAKPTSGQVSLSGETSDLRKVNVRKNIGYMSQKFSLYDDLTVRENLNFYAGVYEIPLNLRKQQIEWVIEACNLQSIEKSIVRSLPLGWKQRIAFGAAVMHDPKIIFLDEPTAGVDPLARRQLWTLIRDFASNGAAILVTTHYLDEAEFCNRLAFMADSKIIAQGTPTEIKGDHKGKLYEIVTDDTQNSFRELAEKLDHWRVAIFGSTIHALLDNEDDVTKAKSILQSAGTQPKVFRPIDFTLEDAFIDVVQRNKREKSSPDNRTAAQTPIKTDVRTSSTEDQK